MNHNTTLGYKNCSALSWFGQPWLFYGMLATFSFLFYLPCLLSTWCQAHTVYWASVIYACFLCVFLTVKLVLVIHSRFYLSEPSTVKKRDDHWVQVYPKISIFIFICCIIPICRRPLLKLMYTLLYLNVSFIRNTNAIKFSSTFL